MSFMIGQKFPTETLAAAMPNGSIEDNFNWQNYAGGKYTVVFYYPLNFTFVCPTEIVAFDRATDAFSDRDTAVIGASVDSAYSHMAWRNTPLSEGGIGPVQFPLVSDMNRTWASQLGIVNESGVTYRAAYLLDKDGVVRHMVINDLPLGRNVDEMIRMVDALQYFEANGEVCPANWNKGERAISASKESTGAYLSTVHGQPATSAA